MASLSGNLTGPCLGQKIRTMILILKSKNMMSNVQCSILALMQDEQRHMRQMFLNTWQKREQNKQLSPLEQQLLEIMLLHPEYQVMLEDPESVDQQFRTDNNPFLHMSLHMGLMEQISTDRPTGIRSVYEALCHKHDTHQAQHLMMDVMGEIIFEAQRSNHPPNEHDYLEQLKLLA